MASGGSSRQSSSSTPWAGQAAFLKDLYGNASAASGGQYHYGPSQVADFAGESQAAFRGVTDRAIGGSSLNRAAQGHSEDTLRGDYLNPESNPFLQRYADVGERNIRRGFYDSIKGLGSSFEGAGRTGGGNMDAGIGVARENLATGLGDFNAQLYGGAYEGERGRMMQAGEGAGALSELDYRDLNALREVGAQREGKDTERLQELYARFQQEQRGRNEKLADYAGLLGPTDMETESRGKSMNFSAIWG